MANIPVVNRIDKRNGLIVALCTMLGIFIYLLLTSFEFPDPPPRDIPMEVEAVFEEIVLKDLQIQGGPGSGKPKDAPIDKPKPQTDKVITTPNEKPVKVPTGESNTTTANNSTNTSSTPEVSNDPFNPGGSGGGDQSGQGTGIGNDNGPSGTGTGGTGSGNSERIRLNNVNVNGIQVNVNAKIAFKLTIDSEGNVVSVQNIKAQTTTSNQSLINKISNAIHSQVKYNKVANSPFVKVFYTIQVTAN